MPNSRLGNVNLLVADTGRSRACYAGAFGLAPDERRSAAPHMLILAGGGCTLSLKTASTEEPGKARGPSDTELGFETDDLTAVRAAILANGGQVGELQGLGFGRTFNARDPDGHPLSVYIPAPENRTAG